MINVNGSDRGNIHGEYSHTILSSEKLVSSATRNFLRLFFFETYTLKVGYIFTQYKLYYTFVEFLFFNCSTLLI